MTVARSSHHYINNTRYHLTDTGIVSITGVSQKHTLPSNSSCECFEYELKNISASMFVFGTKYESWRLSFEDQADYKIVII